MGTSPVSSSSLSLPSLHSPLDTWFSTTHADPHAFSRTGSSSSSSSSSSFSLDPPERRSFLHGIPLDGFHLHSHAPFSQVGSPSNSASKEKPESPFHTTSSCVSAMSNFSLPASNASESSVPQHFRGFHQLGGNTIAKLSEENTPSCISSILTSAKADAVALSAPGSAGAGVTKVSKRRGRINKKAPIAVLSADTSNFRAMVQQLTGIQPPHACPPIWGSSGAHLLRPHPTRFAYDGGLPTLDTSASYLGPKQVFPFLQRAQQPSINELVSGGASNNAAEHVPFQGRGNMVNYDALSSSLTSLPGFWEAMCNGTSSGGQMKGNVKEMSAANVLRECEQTFPRQSSSQFESLLMSDDDLRAKSSVNAVDSWLAYDGVLTSHSPRVDLAKIAS